MLRRGVNPTAARNIVTGVVDSDASWSEDIEITQNGEPYPDINDHSWEMTFYRSAGCPADLTLSTSQGTLSIANSLLSIRVAPSRMSSMCGDYLCDLKSTDASPTIDGAANEILWARGVVTFSKGAS